jgi:hypothetical protein
VHPKENSEVAESSASDLPNFESHLLEGMALSKNGSQARQ